MRTKTLSFLLAACAPLCLVQAQDLKIVSGAADTTYNATVYLKGMGPAGQQITVQGQSFPIYSSGEWAVRLNLKEGDNPYTLQVSDGRAFPGAFS